MFNQFDYLRICNDIRDREFDSKQQSSLIFTANEMAGEVGEACNVIKKIERFNLGLAGGIDPEIGINMLATELADVIITCDLCARKAGIDLWPAVVNKFNSTSDKLGLITRMED